MSGEPGFDEVIHAPNRLQICALLAPVEVADFATIRAGVGISESSLSKHVAILEHAGYIKVHKVSCSPRMKTRLSLTPGGKAAYEQHVAALRAIINRGAAAVSTIAS